jgi:hypothetical protein
MSATDTGISARKSSAILRPYRENLAKYGASVLKAEDHLAAMQMRLGLYAMQALKSLLDANADREDAEDRVLRVIGHPTLNFQTVRKWANAGEVAATLPKAITESLEVETLLPLAGLEVGKREAVAASVIAASPSGVPSRAAMRKAVRKAKGTAEPTDADRAAKLEKQYRDDARVIRAKLASLFGESAKERKAVLSAALLAARIVRGSALETFHVDALTVLFDWTLPEPTDADDS